MARQGELFKTLSKASPIAAHYGRTTKAIVPALAPLIEDPIEDVLQTGKATIGNVVEGETPADPGVIKSFIADWFPVWEDEQIIAVGVCVRDMMDHKRMEDDRRRVMRE